MRKSRRYLSLLLLLVIAAIAVFFILRSRTTAAVGPAVALCPGPDLYGYSCTSGAGYAYIDATQDTQLYAIDGIVSLDLPFPFIFYGTTYTQIQASSNGNLQFNNESLAYLNACLFPEPAADMGDMIAPYWTDLDLRMAGSLETAVSGTPPNRIFVIEWDSVPAFGEDPADGITFEVQLFEQNNDIVFLYEDVTTFVDNQGAGATIGLQSAAQGISLQYGCNQPVVANAGSIKFSHPVEPNQEIGQETQIPPQRDIAAHLPPRKPTQTLIAQLETQGAAALEKVALEQLKLGPTSQRVKWEWADLTGNGRNELILLWNSTPQQTDLVQITVLESDGNGNLTLLLDNYIENRQVSLGQLTIKAMGDLTGDTVLDAVLYDLRSGHVFVLSTALGHLASLSVPEQCHGNLNVLDVDGNGRYEIVRDGCQASGRITTAWNGAKFE